MVFRPETPVPKPEIDSECLRDLQGERGIASGKGVGGSDFAPGQKWQGENQPRKPLRGDDGFDAYAPPLEPAFQNHFSVPKADV